MISKKSPSRDIINQPTTTNPRLLDSKITILNSCDRVLVAGHRGYPVKYPENTLLSFEKAAELGVDMIETDVHLTRDGVPVLIHDYTLQRTTGTDGIVSTLKLDEIQCLDAGSWMNQKFTGEKIPTLEQLVNAMQKYPGLLYAIELKRAAPEAVDHIASIMDKYHLKNKFIILSSNGNVLRYAHDKYGVLCGAYQEEIMVGLDTNPFSGTYSICYCVVITSKYINAERFSYYKNKKLEVWSSTPNTEQAVREHIRYGSKMLCCSDPVPALGIINNYKGMA